VAVSNQAAQNIDAEVDRTAMTRMLNLGDVLQLVDDRFDNGTLASQQLIGEPHQSGFHVALRLGKQLDAAGAEQLLKQRLRHIAPVCKHFAK